MNFSDYIVVTVIYVIITIIAGFLLKNYLPAYFMQKGKNLADKEDIEKLTKIVGEINNKFQKKLEETKTDLEIKKSNLLSSVALENETILSFHGTVSAKMYDTLSIDFLRIKDFTSLEIKDMRNSNNKLVEVYLSLSRIRLNCWNTDLIKKAEKLANSLLLLIHETDNLLMYCLLSKKYIEQNLSVQSITSEDKNRIKNKNEKIMEELNKEIDEYITVKRTNIITDFQSNDITFIMDAKAYLYKYVNSLKEE